MVWTLIASLLPIALLIALGAELRRRALVGPEFWPHAERLGYYILLPSLFLHSLATANLSGLPVAGMAGALVLSTLAVAGVLVAARRVVAVDDAGYTSVFQGSVRFNNYVGVSIATGLFGATGAALAAVANAAIVPTVNVLCVLVFSRYVGRSGFSARALLRGLACNPLIVACLLGAILQSTGWGLPRAVEPVFKALGQASLPLGLLCVGAALDFSQARQWLHPISVASVAKFVLMPLAAFAACRAFHLHGAAAIATLMFQTLPTASSSYIMARQLGGDAPLMAGIIASQTVLAGVALPVMVLWLSAYL